MKKTTFPGLNFRTRFWTFLRMSNLPKSQSGLEKRTKKRLVTIMLSFSEKDEKCCDANFFDKNSITNSQTI